MIPSNQIDSVIPLKIARKLFCQLLTVLSLMIMVSVPLNGQSYLDSLTKTLAQASDSVKLKSFDLACKKLLYEDLEQAKVAAERMMAIATIAKSKNWQARAINNKGSYYFYQGSLDTAITYYQQSLKMYQDLGNEKEVSGILINVASCYGEKGDVTQSMNTHLESLRLQEKLGITGFARGLNLQNLGVLHGDLENHEKSLAYYKQAKKIFQELEDESQIATIDYNIALKLFDIDSVAQAQQILDRLENYHRKGKNVYSLVDVLLESGKNYGVKGDYQKAERLFSEALQIAQENDDRAVYRIIYNKLMGLYLKKGELEQAEKYALLSYQYEKKAGNTIDLTEDLNNLADIYSQKKDFKKAYQYHKEYHALHDSLLGIEKLNAVAELEIKYESEKKEQEIVLFEEKAKRDKITKIGLLGIVFLLCALLGISAYAIKQRHNKNKIAKENLSQKLEFNSKELALRKQELTVYALQLVHKNELLDEIEGKVKDLGEYNAKSIQSILNTININKNNETSWEGFRERFAAIHHDFENIIKEKYPSVSVNEFRLMSLIKMNLSNKEIANILNISSDGIKKARYRLRKKLGMSTNDSLEELVRDI